MNIRPALLQLGGEEHFQAYKREFNRLYRRNAVVDVLGNQVWFDDSSCRHVCHKRDEEDRSARRERNLWSQERAEHIPWIAAALTSPQTEVRPNNHDKINRLNYLLAIEGEYYVVVAEKHSERANVVWFIMAYPIKHRDWVEYRKAGPSLYAPKKKQDE